MTSRPVVVQTGFPGRVLGFGGEGGDLEGTADFRAFNTELTFGFTDPSPGATSLGFWFALDQNLPRQFHPFGHQLRPLQRRQFRPVQVFADLDKAAPRPPSPSP